jgi:hypothetical protein
VLITALSGLLVAGVVTVLRTGADQTTNEVDSDANHRATVVFGNATSGACLNWPPDAPDRPSFVFCKEDHMFEVAQPVDMRNFQEPCQLTVRRYLGAHYDPDSRFTIAVLWPGNAGPQNTERRLLCGLELLGPNGQPIPFKGKVAEQDQSNVQASPAEPQPTPPPSPEPVAATPQTTTPTPVSTVSPAPTTASSTSPAPSAPATTSAPPPPPPPPATTSEAPAPPVIEIPGLAPITLPVFAPAEPPPPAA